MTTRQLEYFVAVARTLNFTRAAKELYVSQTAVTRQIQVLEEEVGAPLFLRTKKKVELTGAGQIFLTEARALLERAGAVRQKLAAAAEGFSGQVRIGYQQGYEKTSFTELVRQFRAENPRIQLFLRRGGGSDLIEALHQGQLDMVFALDYPELSTDKALHRQLLRAYPLRAVLYASHPFAQKESLSLEELAGDTLFSSPPFRLQHCREIETSFVMTSAGLGVCVLPEYATRHLADARNLRVLPVEGQPPVLLCAYSLAEKEDACLRRLWQLVEAFYPLAGG